jgi:FKBP-type peptidyl-prolyl cis-trans isomerase
MKVSKLVLSVLAAGCLLQACNSVDFKKTSAGIPYKVFSSSKGDSIHQNYIVKFMVIQKVKDSILFSSYKDGVPQYAQVQPLHDSLTYMNVGPNIMEIMPKLKTGDSIYLTQSVDSMIKVNPMAVAQFKKGDQIITTVRIVAVYKTPDAAREAYMKDNEAMMKASIAKAAETDRQNLERFKKDTAAQAQLAKDDKAIEAYLAAHHIQAQKTDWGVYMQVLSPGQGPKPEIGKFANVKYRGTNLGGEEFDKGTYPMQIGGARVIKGFEEGVRQMAKGGRAIVYIPSVLGYGANGAPPKIKPNQNLSFELELLDITDTPPQQEQPMEVDSTGRGK